MGTQNCISRRSLLSMSAGAAGLIVGSGPQASSQPGKRKSHFLPSLDFFSGRAGAMKLIAKGAINTGE